MNENASSNITQILTSFQSFMTTFENPLWAKNVTVEEIKTIFKLGHFIEKTITNFKSKQHLEQFFKLMNIWNKQKNLKMYSEDFYTVASDQILEKMFKYPNIKETTLDVGVRVYTSIYPKERFTNFLQKLILTSSSVAAIADFVNSSVSDTTCIENDIILNKWSDYLSLGQKDILKSEIETYLSLYKVEIMLPRILSLLASKDLQEQEKCVQELILECLLEKMLDRSLLSKTFWLVLFQKVALNHIGQVCSMCPTFLESLLNFLEYIGTMMHKNYESDFPEWKSDPCVCFCPEITYFDTLNILKTVCGDSVVKDYVFDRLHRAKEYSNPTLWDELKNEIIENV